MVFLASIVSRVLLPSMLALFFLLLSHALGMRFFSKLKKWCGDNEYVPFFATLFGYAVFGYSALILSYFHTLTPAVAWVVLAVISLVLHREISIACRTIQTRSRVLFRRTKEKPHYAFIEFWLVCGWVLSTVSAFVLPYRTDALAYHIPEIITITQKGLSGLGGVGNFFGNLPKLAECLFAFAYALGGFTVIHLTHLFLVTTTLALLCTFVKNKFGGFVGLCAFLSIFGIYELWVNATNAYIDGATLAYEIAAIVALSFFLETRKREFLVLIGLMLGCAVSVKYLAWYTVVVIGIILLLDTVRASSILKSFKEKLAYAGIPFVFMSFFWYIRNFLRFHNPWYPLLFSHQGFTDAQLHEALIAINAFRERDIGHFFVSPVRLFMSGLHVLIPVFILLSCGIFLIKKEKKLLREWWLFTWLYYVVWFFCISHQARFGMLFQVSFAVLAGIFVGTFFEPLFAKFRARTLVLITFVLLCVVGGLVMWKKNNYFVLAKKAEVEYAFGDSTPVAFYGQRGLGEVYALSAYINEHYHDTRFLHIFADDPSFFLQQGNQFIPPSALVTTKNIVTETDLRQFLAENNISAIISYSPEKIDEFVHDPFQQSDVAQVHYQTTLVPRIIQLRALVHQLFPLVAEVQKREIYHVR